MSTYSNSNRLHVAATPAPHAPDRSGTGWYSSPRQLPLAGTVDQIAAARRESAAASVSIDGDTYKPGHVRDSEGRVWFVFHNGSRRLVKDATGATDSNADAVLVRIGQGTSEIEHREPIAAAAVQSAAGLYALIYAALLVVLGMLIGAVMF